jgi:hypothetical protein
MPGGERARLMRNVNDGIAFFAGDLKPSDPLVPDRWPFVCECGTPDCVQWVELDLGAFAEIRSRGDALLAPGHVAGREVATV